jgi:ABC-type xylose transport system permease subunit
VGSLAAAVGSLSAVLIGLSLTTVDVVSSVTVSVSLFVGAVVFAAQAVATANNKIIASKNAYFLTFVSSKWILQLNYT